MKTILIIIGLIFPIFIFGKSIPTDKKTYLTYKLIGATPVIDGKLDDPAWQNIAWETNFVQYDPYENVQPSQKTAFKIMYDENYLYIAIKAYDSIPSKINRRLSRHDDAQGDYVGIQFDSYNDKLTAFTFIVSAAGVKSDLLYSNDGDNQDYSWDPVWEAKTTIDEQGWNAEMKIPLSQLRFSSEQNQTWGLEVARFLYRKQEMSLWQRIPKDAAGWVHNFGEMEGLKGLKPKRQIEIMPYSVGKYEHYQKDDANPFSTGKSQKLSFGFDGKVGITNNLTLDYTVNPDFGQVEADPSQVNLTGFETYYQEQRPFFVEGKNILSFGLTPGDNSMSGDNLFYSRRIGRVPQGAPDSYDYTNMTLNTTILGAFKITGKTQSGWSVGVLESMTSKETADFVYNGTQSKLAVEPMTNYFVGRLQKDFDKGNTRIGGMLTATNRAINDSNLLFLHKAAYTGGIDFNQNWKNKSYYLNIKVLFSHVEGDKQSIVATQTSLVRNFQRVDNNYVKLDSNRTSLNGSGGLVQFGKQGDGHWQYSTWLNWRSPGLDLDDIGYLHSTDDIFQVLWVQYRCQEPFSIFRNYFINFNQWSGFDFGLNSTYKGCNVNANTQFKNYWSTGGGINYDGENLSNFALRGGPSLRLPGDVNAWFFLSSDNRKKFKANLNLMKLKGAADDISDVNVSLSYQPTNALSASINPAIDIRRSLMQYVTTATVGTENRYIMATINQKVLSASIRLNYSITPNLSIQYYGQPFIATGHYYDFKKIVAPHASNLTDRFVVIDKNMTFDAVNQVYNVSENNNGTVDYQISNPDFKLLQFLSNLVVRWEYVPGSTVFFVWSQNRNTSYTEGDFNFRNDVTDLYHIFPYNVFLIKFSYRFKV